MAPNPCEWSHQFTCQRKGQDMTVIAHAWDVSLRVLREVRVHPTGSSWATRLSAQPWRSACPFQWPHEPIATCQRKGQDGKNHSSSKCAIGTQHNITIAQMRLSADTCLSLKGAWCPMVTTALQIERDVWHSINGNGVKISRVYRYRVCGNYPAKYLGRQSVSAMSKQSVAPSAYSRCN